MVTMENSEEVLQVLERYTRLKQKEIPKELEEYLEYVAKTGDTVFKWSSLKYLFREKLLHVIKNFNEDSPRLEEIPNYPNVDPFNYEAMKSSLLERLDLFNAAPFTIQRLCELLIEPRKQYTRIDKYMRALEKNILVVSTVEPGRKRVESENGDSLDSVVNGELSLEVNIDIEMENEAFNNAEERNAGGNTVSPHRSNNARQDDDSLEPRAKKVKLMCSGNGIDDMDRGRDEVETEDRLSKSDAPDTPAEPDEEDEEQEEETHRISVRSYDKMSAAGACDKDIESEKTNNNIRAIDSDDKVDKLMEKRDTDIGIKDNAQTEKDEEVEVEEERGPIIESEQIASPSPEREIIDELEKHENVLDDDSPPNEPVNADADEDEESDDKLKGVENDQDEEKQESGKATNGEKPKAAEAQLEPEIGPIGDAKLNPVSVAEAKADNDDGGKEVAAIAAETSIHADEAAKETTNLAPAAEIVEEVEKSKTEEKNKDKLKEELPEKLKQDANKEEITKADKPEIPTSPPSKATVNAVAVAGAVVDGVAAEPVPIETDEPLVTDHAVVPNAAGSTVEATTAAAIAPIIAGAAAAIAADTATPVTPLPQVAVLAQITVPAVVPVSVPVPAPAPPPVDQPMDEEQQASPNAVEEVVMAELSKTDEPARMEVDDTSQEAMDQ